jgi:uncharacterized protein (DUF1684 family)
VAHFSVLARALPALALCATAACNPRPPDETDYVGRLQALRADKDAEFQRSNDPIPANRKAELLPLAYFPVDPAYNVPAELKPSPESPTLMMPTSTGTLEAMRRVGQLEFTLHGKPLKLTAFVAATAPNADRLFLPFSDLTSGTETYPAGRYLDLTRSPTGLYEVDFNYAYNPFCYFNVTYVCPIPPPENRLDVRIEAGEKIRK